MQDESEYAGEAIDVQPSGGWGVSEQTGDAAVDEALRALTWLDRQPVHEHAAVFEQVHRALQDRLADEPTSGATEGRE